MAIKSKLVKMAARITGRKCSLCVHNWSGRCCHPDGHMFIKCWNSLHRPGFERSEAVEYVEAGKALCEGFQDGAQHKLTPEEEYQLQKIKIALEVAEDLARESGLITED